MSESDPYLLGYRRAEQERLERQADELAHESAWLFDHIGVGDGWRVAEIGCCPRGCLGLLSERLRATGRDVGARRSREPWTRAQRFGRARCLPRVAGFGGASRRTGLRDSTI